MKFFRQWGKGFLSSFLEIAETFLISVAAVLIIRTYIAQPFLVSGTSMEPSFYDGNYLLIDEFSYYLRAPKRGEVVVFRPPSNPKSYYIKRIIGLPHEKIVVNNGDTIIIPSSGENSKKEIYLKESYIKPSMQVGNFEFELGADEYFVMGDNRNFSFDSRNWGPVKNSNVIGIVRLRLWPLNQIKLFGTPDY